MNLSPRQATPFLVPLCVFGGGLSLANCIQITELYTLYGERWMAWAAIVFMTVTCALTLVIAVALRPVEPEPPAPAPQFTAEQIAAVEQYADLRPIVRPDENLSEFRLTLNGVNINMPEGIPLEKLYHGIRLTILTGMASVRKLEERPAKFTEPQTKAMREWLFRNGWATDERGAAKLTPAGREALEALLPRTKNWRR